MSRWLELLLMPHGRATRGDLGLRVVLPFALVEAILPGGAIANDLSPAELVAAPWTLLTPFGWAFAALSLLAYLMVAMKRCHDRDRSGAFLLLYLVPVIGTIWVSTELHLCRGTRGANRFGPDPLQPGSEGRSQPAGPELDDDLWSARPLPAAAPAPVAGPRGSTVRRQFGRRAPRPGTAV